jgi:nuclear transport factor 2 (NTF2) superfamily protein
MSRPPFPPFTAETAARKARMAEDAWNTRDPARVALAYAPDTHAYRLSSGALVGIMSSNKGLSHDPHTRRSLA